MIDLIYNPTAGKGRSRRFRETAERMLAQRSIPHTFHPTQGPNDAGRIARELYERGSRDIVAVGGDGTIHEILNGLPATHDVRLGILPCGSGNDLAAAAGIPLEPEAAVRLLIDGQARPTDYLLCSGIRSLNVLGTGIDVEILRYAYSAKLLKGSLNYFVSLLRALLGFRFYGLQARFPGHDAHHSALIVCACNGRRIGGGIPICPEAVMDDGLLDIVLVEDIRRAQIPGALVKLMGGRITQQPFTRHIRTDRLTVVTDRPATIQIDGELYDDLPFDVSVVPSGIRLYRP